MSSAGPIIASFACGFLLAVAVVFGWFRFRRVRLFHRSPKNLIPLPLSRMSSHPSEALASPYRFGSLQTRSARVKEILKAAEIISMTSSTVLLQGESGTGKEVMARALHETGPRKTRPFVAVHAAALPESLLESELFGHEKGAFTGALDQRKGRCELAQGGTLFLDEVGDLSPAIQVKLLRVIQERSFERLGGTDTIHVDVRIVAATNRDLRDLVRKNQFREDLFYRLHVVVLHLLPLRERKEDLPLLVEELVARHAARLGKKVSGRDDSLLELLATHNFPGNIRELENIIERAIVFSRESKLTAADVDLGDRLSGPVESRGRTGIEWEGFAKKVDYEKLIEAYYRKRGNKTAAARTLNMPESTYRYHLKRAIQQKGVGERSK